MKLYYPAILALEDSSIFEGKAIQPEGIACGEVVFNTAVTGCQEILTDCSYAGQLVSFTCPHIGNVGTNPSDTESHRVWPRGIIVRSLSCFPSNWRSQEAFPEYLLKNNCLMIGDLDTRALTQKLRAQGTLKGCIMVSKNVSKQSLQTRNLAVKMAQEYNELETKDLTEMVSTKKPYSWTEGSLWPEKSPILSHSHNFTLKPHIVVYDFGVKHNILRCLVDLGCRVTVIPRATPLTEVFSLLPDGILFSNGPGDPKLCTQAIQNIRSLYFNSLNSDRPQIPLFGICLGHQLLTLALGGNTVKMKFGHHGANHPVQDLKTGRVLITSQNHNFMIDENFLPEAFEITHRSLFDHSPQGIKHRTKPVSGFQGHPEASPGPMDAKYIFSDFIQAALDFQETRKTVREVMNA